MATAVSAGSKGKLPETIDLTRPSAFQPSSGARKLVIKNLRPPSASRDAKVAEHYKQAERELFAALDAILVSQKPAVPLERLFRAVEDLCRKGEADKVYRRVKEQMEKHVQDYILPRVRADGEASNFDMVKSLQAQWTTFNQQMVS